MHIDKYGQQIYSEIDLCGLLMQDPTRVIEGALVSSDIKFDSFLELSGKPRLLKYHDPKVAVSAFDRCDETRL